LIEHLGFSALSCFNIFHALLNRKLHLNNARKVLLWAFLFNVAVAIKLARGLIQLGFLISTDSNAIVSARVVFVVGSTTLAKLLLYVLLNERIFRFRSLRFAALESVSKRTAGNGGTGGGSAGVGMLAGLQHGVCVHTSCARVVPLGALKLAQAARPRALRCVHSTAFVRSSLLTSCSFLALLILQCSALPHCLGHAVARVIGKERKPESLCGSQYAANTSSPVHSSSKWMNWQAHIDLFSLLFVSATVVPAQAMRVEHSLDTLHWKNLATRPLPRPDLI
jgi:hypothetical protein